MIFRGISLASLVLLLGVVSPAQAKVKKEVASHFSLEAVEAPSPADLNLELASPPKKVGLVSWYGPGFHGHRTASGERYNMHAMTCASRDLPFGTMLELTNTANGEKAIVRVNDRGPFMRWRILDLSYAAAKKLGFYRSGQAQVEVRELASVEEVADSNDFNHP